MPTTSPSTTPVPDEDSGFVARIEKWFEGHIAPDVAKVQGDIADLRQFYQAHAQNIAQLANVVVETLKTVAPADSAGLAAVVAAADRVLADAKRISEEFTGSPGVG